MQYFEFNDTNYFDHFERRNINDKCDDIKSLRLKKEKIQNITDDIPYRIISNIYV
jgi:hypothetical protein